MFPRREPARLNLRAARCPWWDFSMLLRRYLVRDVFHRFLDLVDLRMDFLDQIMFGLREFLDPLGHVVQFLQHLFLARGQAVHPPKTDGPANSSDPSENERDRH